jgi:hypothetical protein
VRVGDDRGAGGVGSGHGRCECCAAAGLKREAEQGQEQG